MERVDDIPWVLDIDFRISPVSRSHRTYGSFKKRVAAELEPKATFLFAGEVKVHWILYLNEIEKSETDKIADLDNFAKGFNDIIKGPKGVLIDDTQVQMLSISWEDAIGEPYFRLIVEPNHPDDVMRKPVKLYEMPDGLLYPISELFLNGTSNDNPAGLAARLSDAIATSQTLMKRMREAGASSHEVDEARRMTKPLLLGFHKSRVAQSGFEWLRKGVWSPPSSE